MRDKALNQPQTLSVRHIEELNESWKFAKLPRSEGLSSLPIEAVNFDDSSWQNITLPHTWNSTDGADGCIKGDAISDETAEGYYRGLGGYRRTLFLPENIYGGKEVYIEFEGANTVAKVYLNGCFVGRHEGGYSAFRFDITPYILPDRENILTVKVSNAAQDYILPITNQGDFTKMGGIYRNVRIIAVNRIHIDLMDLGSSGVYVTPKNISNASSDISIRVLLANDSLNDKNLTVTARITDPYGKEAGKVSVRRILTAGERASSELETSIEDPVLWDGVKSPLLYSAEISIEADGLVCDSCRQSFGIRRFSVDPDCGFILNGVPIRLNGVNYHQDSYESGWAIKREQFERDYEMMLKMGCNSVRMAHYQHNPYEYELCDRLGLTVWTEIPLINRITADESKAMKIKPELIANAKQQLTELIKQNYNHPSVVFWGISNELYQMNDEIYEIFSELCHIAKGEDCSRLITFADNQCWGKFLDMPTDVVGCNKYFGWYKEAGSVEELGAWLDNYHTANSSRPICLSEYGGGAALTQFKDNIDWLNDIDPWGSRHYQNYQSLLHERLWAQLSQRQYLFGCYIWCIFDFASAGRQEGDTAGQNDKGLATRLRIPKDSFYFYKSVWNDEPMLHLTEKGFSQRSNMIPQIKAYSNGESAELFINGASKGRIMRSDLDPLYSTVFTWDNVEILPDYENEIKVKAWFADGSVLIDSAFWSCK